MKTAVILGDLISFCIAMLATIGLRIDNKITSDIATIHIEAFLMLYFSWVFIFFLFDLYDIFNIKPTIPHLKRFGWAIISAFIWGIVFFYVFPYFGIAPKTNLLILTAIFATLSFFTRRLLYTLNIKKKKTVLIGNETFLKEFFNKIENNPQVGLKIISFKEDPNIIFEKYKNLKKSIFIIDKNCFSFNENEIIHLIQNKNELIDVATAYEKYLYKIPTKYISSNWLIENINYKKNISYSILSRIFEIIFSVTCLIASSPFVVIASIFIFAEDRKKIFYTQERVGLNGEKFKIYKLRSMIIDSEKNGAMWSTEKDNRVTKTGKIIRRLHIDEIPQLINVIKGDIALVGPRPERPEFVEILEKEIPHYNTRHYIKPGFTGWAQIKYHYARTNQDSLEKFEYDLYYIKNRNIFMDLGILARTIQIIIPH